MPELFYAAIILALALACAAGVLYFYLMFLEARSRQQARRVAELERENAALLRELQQARARLARGDAPGGEEWPEVLGERDDYTMN